MNTALEDVRKGSRLEVHHLIEVRVAERLGFDTANSSVVLDKDVHQGFTNKWLAEIARINSAKLPRTNTATLDDVWEAAQRVYKNDPEYLAAVKEALGGDKNENISSFHNGSSRPVCGHV